MLLSHTPSIVAFRQFQNEHQILNRTNVGKIPKTIDTVWENERVKKMHVTENEIENIEKYRKCMLQETITLLSFQVLFCPRWGFTTKAIYTVWLLFQEKKI